jgi:hypothetical protein
MLKHIVFFRLKGYKTEEKDNLLTEMKTRFNALKDSISEISFLEVGINQNTRSVAFDICLFTLFDNKEKLDFYQIHPAHQDLLKFLDGIEREIAVVDYEF